MTSQQTDCLLRAADSIESDENFNWGSYKTDIAFHIVKCWGRELTAFSDIADEAQEILGLSFQQRAKLFAWPPSMAWPQKYAERASRAEGISLAGKNEKEQENQRVKRTKACARLAAELVRDIAKSGAEKVLQTA